MMGDGMMRWMQGGMAWMFLCAFLGLILLAGIVLLIVWAVKSFGKGRQNR